jgi:glycerophosphoryl diester phosphodiesterase
MILWSHRGYTNKEPEENTIKSLKSAYNEGYRNIEFDIWYLNDELFLKHNKPTIEELQNKTLTTLKEYLSVYKNKINYWMDFKNLSKQNISKALECYKKIINEVGINPSQIYFTPYKVNWEKAIFLQKKASAKLIGINNVFIKNNNSFDKTKITEYYKILKKNKIKYLSIQHDLVDKEIVKSLRNITLFVWTVNEKEEYNRLKKLGIQNICTDKITNADI